MILQRWSFWTFPLLSTRSTTLFCSNGCRPLLALMASPLSGSSHIWLDEHSMSAVALRFRLPFILAAVYPRVQFWAPFCSSCTRWIMRIDADLSMRTHVQCTVSRCFSSLRRLRSIRGHVPMSVYQSLVIALVLSRLDYCNCVLVGLPASLIQRLQSVQNAALLDSFTALDVPSTLQTLWSAFTGYSYKNGSSLKLLFWHIEQYTALHHLICRRSSLVSLMWPHVSGWDRRLPTNSSCRHTACLQSERGPSRSPVPTSGTVCRRMWPPLHHCRCSDNAWRHFCFAATIRTYVLSELCFALSGSGPSSIFHT